MEDVSATGQTWQPVGQTLTGTEPARTQLSVRGCFLVMSVFSLQITETQFQVGREPYLQHEHNSAAGRQLRVQTGHEVEHKVSLFTSSSLSCL